MQIKSELIWIKSIDLYYVDPAKIERVGDSEKKPTVIANRW